MRDNEKLGGPIEKEKHRSHNTDSLHGGYSRCLLTGG